MKSGLIFAAIYFLILAPFVGIPDVGGSSEAREIHVARIIYETDNWILPKRAGLVPSKPLLFHWTVAGLGKLSGEVSEATARTVSLFAGSVILFLTVWLATALMQIVVPYAAASTRRVAVFAGGALALSYQFLRLSMDARVDAYFSMFAVAAICIIFHSAGLYAAGRGDFHSVFSKTRLQFFFLLCGFSVLAKGPLGIVLPGLIAYLLVWSVSDWRSAAKLFFRPSIGWLVFLLIAMPWYVLAAINDSGDFVSRQIVFENILRFFGSEYVNSQPIWFYIPSFVVNLLPWSVLFILLVALDLRSEAEANNALEGVPNSTPRRLRRLCLIWLGAGIAFFSCASGKRDSYLLPLFTPVAIYIAWSAELWWLHLSSWAKCRIASACRMGCFSLLVILALTMAALEFVDPRIFSKDPLAGQAISFLQAHLIAQEIWILSIITVSLIILYFASHIWQRAALAVFLTAGSIAFFLTLGLGVKNDLKGFRAFARELRNHLPEDVLVHALRFRNDEYLDPVLYYLGGALALKEPPLDTRECNGFYLSRRNFYDDASSTADKTGSEVVLMASFRNSADRLEGRRDRDIVLFRCNLRLAAS